MGSQIWLCTILNVLSYELFLIWRFFSMVIFEKHISEGRNFAFYFQEGVVSLL